MTPTILPSDEELARDFLERGSVHEVRPLELAADFAAHRELGAREGYDKAIAGVVAWLRNDAGRALFSPWQLANRIECGDHLAEEVG